MLRHSAKVMGAMLALSLGAGASAGEAPDLYTLKNSGFVIGPGSSSYPVHRSWKEYTDLMSDLNIFDNYISRLAEVFCTDETNQSVLFVGEPSDTFRYIWARLATYKLAEHCPQYWHVEIDEAKIEAGHKYVGEVEEYWQNNVLKPVDGKDAILYFGNLDYLVGLGSHSNNNDGIETEFVANITQGRMKAVAYLDKYQYNSLRGSDKSYVVNSFAETIVIEPVTMQAVDRLVRRILEVKDPELEIPEKTLQYLYRVSEYYQPNTLEPQRTVRVINSLLRTNPKSFEEKELTLANPIQTTKPYAESESVELKYESAGALGLKVKFDYFDTEKYDDVLEIVDGNTGTVLAKYHGQNGAFETKWFDTDKLTFRFNADGDSTVGDGFNVAAVVGRAPKTRVIDFESVRTALFDIVQVPRWLVERNYDVIRNLPDLINADVVGVVNGKRDLIRLAQNGYIAGRTDEKPVGSALLAGPTGTGKSYIAKKMAEFMGMKLITIDMTSFRSVESLDRFLDIVARALTNNPYAIYLFEEIDKADVGVLDRLYFMLDEGIFYDKQQRPLFARGAFLLFTTNAGSDVIIKERENPELENLVDLELQKVFRPSFLNRFDARSIFLPFTQAEYVQLAQTMVDKKILRVGQYFDWTLSVDKATVEYLGKHGQSKIYGARPMERLVENVISTGIAQYQLKHEALLQGSKFAITKAEAEHEFTITVDGGQAITFEVDHAINTGGGDDSTDSFFSGMGPNDFRRLMDSNDSDVVITKDMIMNVFAGDRVYR